MSPNNKKDPLEEFFRKRAWDYDISFHEEDWMDLEDRLEILDRQYARRNRRRWMAAASILLLLLVGYFTYDNYTKINEISRQLNDETVQQNGQPELTEERPLPVVPDSVTREQSRSGREEQDAAAPEPEGSTLAARQPGTVPEAEEDVAATGQDPAFIEEGPTAFTELVSGRLYEPELDMREASASGFFSDDEADGGAIDLSHLSTAESDTPSGRSIFSASSEPITPVDSQNRPSRLSSSRFAVGLVMSPDLSTAGSISDFYQPGYKIGIQLEYRITRNLSVSAGLMQSKVRYKAGISDYSPPQGYWTGGNLPEETIGVCSLIDIPVNLKYDFLQLERSRFYATAGLSSYIMQNEDYRFYYRNSYSGQADRWNEHTGTRHWLSNANFSIGYELDLLRNWGIRAEPFVKVPLKEVGWGNVKLYSLGTFVSLNYKIP